MNFKIKNLPRKEKWLIQVIVDTNNQIIISNTIDLRSRKLPIYQYSLQKQTQTPTTFKTPPKSM